MPKGKHLRPYYVGLGAEGVVLESHKIHAYNKQEAESQARKFLHPDKGYNYLVVVPLKVIKAEKAE